MKRRNLFKTGFTIAGGSLLASVAGAKIEIKGERLPKFVLDFSDEEAPPKK